MGNPAERERLKQLAKAKHEAQLDAEESRWGEDAGRCSLRSMEAVAMSDIFSRQNDAFTGSFSADGAAITFPHFGLKNVVGQDAAFLDENGQVIGADGAGLLVQCLNIQYSQIITKVYELDTPFCYYIGGRTQGGMGLSRIIGPRPIQVNFYSKFGDVRDVVTNDIDIIVRAGCPTADAAGIDVGPSIYSSGFCVINYIGLSVAAADVVITEQLQMLFGSLRLRD
jgi:hypothetical protein